MESFNINGLINVYKLLLNLMCMCTDTVNRQEIQFTSDENAEILVNLFCRIDQSSHDDDMLFDGYHHTEAIEPKGAIQLYVPFHSNHHWKCEATKMKPPKCAGVMYVSDIFFTSL